MDFALNDEQQEFKERCRTFAREVIRPAARKHDEEESTPWEVIKEARKQGFGGLEAIQRSAADPEGQMQVISAEEFHWGCAGIALAISGSGLAAAGIASSGTPEQIAPLGPRVLRQRRGDQARRLRGDRAAGRLRRQEPEDDRQARRRRVGPQRHQGLHHQRRHRRRPRRRRHRRPRRSAPAARPPSSSARARPGLSQGKKESKLGIRASHTAEIVLEDCRIPVENLLGGEEKLEKKLQRGREGQEVARRRRAGDLRDHPAAGRRLGARHRPGRLRVDPRVPRRPVRRRHAAAAERSAIQQTLADVATEIEAARLLVQRAAWMGRNGMPMTGGQGSMSKLKAGDVTMWATTTLMDLVGPYAWSTECPLEKWFRDAKIYQLFEGTAEIQRMVISRMQAREYAERLGYAAEVADAGRQGAGPARPAPTEPIRRSRRSRPATALSSGRARPHGHSARARRAARGQPAADVGGAGDQRRRCSSPRRSAASSPARWRCSPTPGTCSPTSARSSSP